MTNEELERAVERLKAGLGADRGTAIVSDCDLRALLSERAELLAAFDVGLAASPQGEGSSANAIERLATHPPQPDALPGDLREKVAAVLYENIGAAAWSGDAEVHGIPEAADAILSLIQSEKKEQ